MTDSGQGMEAPLRRLPKAEGGSPSPLPSLWGRLTLLRMQRDEPEHPGRVVQATHRILGEGESAKERAKGGSWQPGSAPGEQRRAIMGWGSPDQAPAGLPGLQAVGEPLDQRRLVAVLHTPAAPGGSPLVAQGCGRESGGQEGTGTPPPPTRGSRERGRRASPGRAGSSSSGSSSSTSGLRLVAKVRRESEPPGPSPAAAAAIPPRPPLLSPRPKAKGGRPGEPRGAFQRLRNCRSARGGGGAAGARPLDAPANAEASGGPPKVSGHCPPRLPAWPSAAPGRFLGGRSGPAPGPRTDGRGGAGAPGTGLSIAGARAGPSRRCLLHQGEPNRLRRPGSARGANIPSRPVRVYRGRRGRASPWLPRLGLAGRAPREPPRAGPASRLRGPVPTGGRAGRRAAVLHR